METYNVLAFPVSGFPTYRSGFKTLERAVKCSEQLESIGYIEFEFSCDSVSKDGTITRKKAQSK